MLPRALNSSMQRTSTPHARPQLQSRSRSQTVAVRAADEGWAWRNKTASRDRRPENVAGDFYVDHTCIDCDTCRWMAPETFTRRGGQSAVHQQPDDNTGRVRALQALLSCPTFSIHTDSRTPAELQAAQQGLPRLVPGTTSVYHCGWHSERSFGAAAYLIVRPQEAGGNVLVDVPRWNPVLVKQVAALGGVQTIFLTHKDDVGDHKKWAAHFKAPRILHSTEVVEDTSDVEHKLTGEGPWTLPGDTSDDIALVFTPGHTSGHVCLYYAPEKVMFTGDHLSADVKEPTRPDIMVDFNWYSVQLQVESVAKLLQYDFLHVLPGHGRPLHFKDAAQRLEGINQLVEHHKQQGYQGGKYRQMREEQWAEQAAAAKA